MIHFAASTQPTLTAQPNLHQCLSFLIRPVSVGIRILHGLIIFVWFQSLQKATVNQPQHVHGRNKLRPHARLLKPRRNRAQPNHKLLCHLVNMIIKRIFPVIRNQVIRRQRALNIRRPQGCQERAVLRPEAVQLLAHGEGDVAYDGDVLVVDDEAVGGRVYVCPIGFCGCGPFFEELGRAERAEARVCPQFGPEWKFGWVFDWPQPGVAADIGVVCGCDALAGVWEAVSRE